MELKFVSRSWVKSDCSLLIAPLMELKFLKEDTYATNGERF